MFSKIVAMISAILLSVLSMTSFNSYAVESELFLEKNTTFTSPNKIFTIRGFGGEVQSLLLQGIIQYIYEKSVIDAGLNNTIQSLNLLYGKERITGTNLGLTDGLAEMLYVPLVNDGERADFVYDCYLILSGCGQYDGVYTYNLVSASKIDFSTSGTVVIGVPSPFSIGGQTTAITNVPASSRVNFQLLATNNIYTRSFANNVAFPPVERFLYADSYYNCNTFTLSFIYTNDNDINTNINNAERTRKSNPFIKVFNNIYKANDILTQQVKTEFEQNKYTLLYNAVQNAKNQYYNTYNSFPAYNSNMNNVTEYNNLNTEYNINYNSFVPIVPPPESSGGGGVPSDWLGSYPPLSTAENFHIDNESVVSYVENVDFQPLSDSFRLFGFVSDFLAEINVLPIFLSLLGLGLICWIIF